MTNSRKQFTIPDIGQNLCRHPKGRETYRFGRGQKYFTIQLNKIKWVFGYGTLK